MMRQGCYYQYHSTADEWVPFWLGEKLWAAAENVDASCSTFSTEDLVSVSSQALLAMLLPGCNESCTRLEFSLFTGGAGSSRRPPKRRAKELAEGLCRPGACSRSLREVVNHCSRD
jgi:hypothetical protein